MRMIERRHGADAHEFLGADIDHSDAQVIVKMRNDRVRHACFRFAGGTIAAPPTDFQQSMADKGLSQPRFARSITISA